MPRLTPGVLALGVATLACGGHGGQAGAPGGMPAMPVKIAVARQVKVDDSTEYVASIRSRSSASIMPDVEGRITRILVKAGQHVAAGAPLVEIDPARQEATVRTQQDTRSARAAAVALARQQHERVQGLFRQGITSQQDLDQAKAALDSAEAELRAAEAQVSQEEVQLHRHHVDAPTSGTVGDIPVRVGDRVTVSTLLTTVDSAGGLEAYVPVPVERAPQLKVGLPLRLVDGQGTLLRETRVAFVASEVDDRTQTVLAKAAIDDTAGLRPSQFVRARVVWGTREGPVVPVLAVSRVGGQAFVFVAQSEKGALVARQRSITLGEIVGNDYVVRDGIKPGDQVIVSGTQMLREGAAVKVES